MFARFLLLFFLFPLCCFGQLNLTHLSVGDYHQELSTLILLKDSEVRVPLKGLDSLNVVYWYSGTEAEEKVWNALDDYAPASKREYGQIPPGTNFLIAYSNGQLDEQEVNQLLEAAEDLPFALLLGANMDSIRTPKLLNAASIVILTAEIHPGLGISLLFGGVGSQSRWLSPSPLAGIPIGAGIDAPHGLRLTYAPPEWVGMDRTTLQDSLDNILQEGIAKGAFPGAQVLVARKGKVVFHKAYGYHTYDSLRRVQLHHLYDFASLTKITGALPALIKLYGEGTFDLDAPLKSYLPEFKGSNKARMIFRDMLAHQARLRPWIPYWQGTLKENARYPWKKSWQPTLTNEGNFRKNTFQSDSSSAFYERITDRLWLHESYPDKIYKAIRKSPLRENNDYVYSGLLFYLLPDIVSRMTQENYQTYLDRQFYYKLGARTLTYNPLTKFPLDRIVPTERDTFFRKQLLHGTVHDEGAAMMQGVSSNAGLFGTSLDLAKLLQLYLNKGSYGGEYYFSPEAIEEFSRYQYPDNDNRRGLGFDKPPYEYVWGDSYVAPQASAQSYGHSGYTGTFAWVDPAEDLIFIFFSNRVYPSRNNRKLYQLNLRPRMHRAVYQAIITSEPTSSKNLED